MMTHAAVKYCADGALSCGSLGVASSRVSGWGAIAPVVERTLSWLNRFRRLTVRYERRADIQEAFLSLGYAWRVLMVGKEAMTSS
jgi:hypothetical protein